MHTSSVGMTVPERKNGSLIGIPKISRRGPEAFFSVWIPQVPVCSPRYVECRKEDSGPKTSVCPEALEALDILSDHCTVLALPAVNSRDS